MPLIENAGEAYLDQVLDDYLDFTKEGAFDALLLGCTHYIHLKDRIAARYDFDVLAQDDIIPDKLVAYLNKHTDIDQSLGRNGAFEFFVTDLTDGYAAHASALFGHNIEMTLIGDIHG